MSFFNNDTAYDPCKVAKTYAPIPEGEYDLIIEKCEGKTSKAGNRMLSLKFRIDGGEYDGRFLFENILMDHEKPSVVEMNTAKLHGMMGLTGVHVPKEPSDFEGKTMRTKVVVKQDKGSGQMKNEVSFRVKAGESKQVESKPTPKVERKASAGGEW